MRRILSSVNSAGKTEREGTEGKKREGVLKEGEKVGGWEGEKREEKGQRIKVKGDK